MKKGLFVLSLFIIVSLSGCSSISQEEYDSVVAERDETVKKLDTLQADYNSMSKEYDSKSNDYEKLHSEYQILESERKERVDKEMELAGTKAWVTTCFGDDSIYFVENTDYLQCISSNRYSCTLGGIKDAWNDQLSAMKLLPISITTPYEKIAVKYLDDDQKILIEFVIKRKNDTYELDSVTCDAFRATTIIPILAELVD